MPTPARADGWVAVRPISGTSWQNLTTALFEHGKITTTEAEGTPELRPYAERLITFAKRGDLHARRQVLTVVTDRGVVHTLFSEIGPQVLPPARAVTPGSARSVRARVTNAPLAVIGAGRGGGCGHCTSRRRRPRRAPAPARQARPKADAEAATAGVRRCGRGGGARPRTPRPRTSEADDTEAEDVEAQDAVTEDSAAEEPEEAFSMTTPRILAQKEAE